MEEQIKQNSAGTTVDTITIVKANEYLKSQVRTMKEIIQLGEAKPHHCRTCKHFMQHYIKGIEYIGGYSAIDCGHCTMRGKGIKNRKDKHATDNICEFYELGEFR